MLEEFCSKADSSVTSSNFGSHKSVYHFPNLTWTNRDSCSKTRLLHFTRKATSQLLHQMSQFVSREAATCAKKGAKVWIALTRARARPTFLTLSLIGLQSLILSPISVYPFSAFHSSVKMRLCLGYIQPGIAIWLLQQRNRAFNTNSEAQAVLTFKTWIVISSSVKFNLRSEPSSPSLDPFQL